MLSKQSIRGKVQLFLDGKPLSKEEAVALSESWSEREEMLFRKMLKQGGHFKLKGRKFVVELSEADNKRSDGSKDGGVVQVPGEDGKF